MADTELNPDGPHSPDHTAELGDLFDACSRAIVYATMPGKGGLVYPADAYRLAGDLYAATGRFEQICEQLEQFIRAQADSGRLYEARGRNVLIQRDQAAIHLDQAAMNAHALTVALQAFQADISGLGVKDSVPRPSLNPTKARDPEGGQ